MDEFEVTRLGRRLVRIDEAFGDDTELVAVEAAVEATAVAVVAGGTKDLVRVDETFGDDAELVAVEAAVEAAAIAVVAGGTGIEIPV